MSLLRFFIVALLLTSTATFAADKNSEEWITRIRAEEKAVFNEVEKLRTELYKNSSAKNRANTLKRTATIKKKLLALKKEIDSVGNTKFEEKSSDKWRSVVQQAKALHALSEESIQDLEGLAKSK